MITTVKFKDLIKYLVVLTSIIIIIVLATRYFLDFKENNNQDKKINSNNFLECINISIPISKTIENSENEQKNTNHITSRSGIVRILDMGLLNIEEKEEKQEKTESEEVEENKTKKVEIKDSYTNTYKTVKVKNLTDIKLTESILKPDYNVKNKDDIIIFHTHTCESYTPTKKNTYKASGNYRTTNLKYSVARVGDVLEEELKSRGFKVTHNTTKHDYPAYSGSYTRSLETVQNILKKQKDAEIIFDVHRDAVGDGSSYGPTVKINGETVAQLMFVIGTNDGGGKHPNWKKNLKFAVKVQEKANEMYPGLFRAINLRSSTFNQKVSNAASIIEVGATGNTLEEAEASMKYLANALEEILK